MLLEEIFKLIGVGIICFHLLGELLSVPDDLLIGVHIFLEVLQAGLVLFGVWLPVIFNLFLECFM